MTATGLILTGLGTGSAQAAKRGKDPRITKMMKGMTLEEKVGQLFVTYAYGDRADTTDPGDVALNRQFYGVDNASQLVDKYHLGGIIYFAWSNNTKDPQQIAGLSNGIQRAAMRQRAKIPMLISTDQEGGSVVARILAPATQLPGNMALGAGRRVGDAYTAARVSGTELHAMGVNQDFAPVADVNVDPANPVIGVRSFSSDPQMAARLTGAAVRGYQNAGVSSTAKHFPGHGDTATDSHTGVPRIDHTREEWERLDMPPFQSAIKSGIDSIMTAHIIVPSLDPAEDPATLSRPILTGILRERLRYDGVVITDALGMQGVRDKYGDERVPVLALKAGVDQLLKSPDGAFDLQYNAVLNAVRSGELTEKRIDESVYRVLRLKMKRGLFKNPYVDETKVPKVVGSPQHLATAQRITDATTTLVKSDAGLLPLAKDGRKVLVTGWGVSTTQTLAGAIAKRGPQTSVYETGISPSQATIGQAVTRAGANDLVVVVTNRAWDIAESKPGEPHNGPGQMNLTKALVATGKPVIVVAARDPYDIGYFTEASTFLATFSYTGHALESVARVLYGEKRPQGRLPVRIPVAGQPDQTLYPYGHGLSLR
ncbi:glycoside hydrolase family 3 protein [Actinomadura sp. HBU206391]|uniref:glycoside hydrolase family 3 protein n=1 Tax=Actinomadura sp. HBU206391 TaxID=2731692 RepID=UPI00164FE123|nr:glycoside hydrolase family 3 protein [Actinomadura sp. HBU206391]MBC6456713.1 glycoside hydrolase family 3 C-terminal domain-containing protein [Actinomadura sp. HBU206391]